MSTLHPPAADGPACPWHADGRFAPDLALEDYPSTMLTRLAQAIQVELSSAYTREHGLSVSEWRMLARLNSVGSIQLADFCRETGMDKAYVSRLVRSLQPLDLIRVQRDPQHGRKLIVEITPQGRSLARRVLPKARAAQEELMQVLSPSERVVFYGAVKKLQAALEQRPSTKSSP